MSSQRLCSVQQTQMPHGTPHSQSVMQLQQLLLLHDRQPLPGGVMQLVQLQMPLQCDRRQTQRRRRLGGLQQQKTGAVSGRGRLGLAAADSCTCALMLHACTGD